MRKRNHRVEVYLSDKEYETLVKKVEKTGLSKAEYLRTLIKDITPKEHPPMQFFDVLRELRQLNVNMNQIAMTAHSLNLIDAPFYLQCHKELQKAVGEIMLAVYSD